MATIKPKTDRKPGARPQRFASFLDPANAMAETKTETVDPPVNDILPENRQESNRKTSGGNWNNGQPIRIDKGIWLRLKTYQLKLEAQGQRKTLMDLTNEALEVFLTARGE